MTPTIAPTIKQHQAYQILQDNETIYFLFGGGAGGGKTHLGCEWLMTNCFIYPGTRWFIGREELKRLKDSSLVTFFKVCSFHKIPQSEYNFNGQDNSIIFANGSRVDLLDLKFLPSDPLYERYGSIEYTGGWIEEAGEVNFNAFDTLKSRIGRHLNDKYNLLRKMLITCNPKKNWLYTVFYLPWKNKTLPKEYKFVQALVDDNPKNESGYKKGLLDITDKAKKERLLFGNWEYDDDPSTLIDYEAIIDLFTNSITNTGMIERYIVADIARFGVDKTVITLWDGLKCYRIESYERQATNQTAERIKEIARLEQIPFSHILIDEDGIGGGVVDQLKGVKGFTANSSPLPKNGKIENFNNLKSQCAYTLAKMVNEHALAVRLEDEKIKELLIEELEQIKSKDPDTEGKQQIMPKDKVKELIGRSPDYADCFIMRMYFEFKKPFITQQFIPNHHGGYIKR